LIAVHTVEHAKRIVVLDYRARLAQVYLNSILHHLATVVRPLIELSSTHLARRPCGRGVENLVIRRLAVVADPAPREASDEHFFWYVQIDSRPYGRAPSFQSAVQRSSLRKGAWKSIQKNSPPCVCFVEPLHDHLDD
jgi:hypothetical protein